MQDSILNRFRNVLKIKIEGRNLERFIHRMIKNKIEIIEIKYKNYKEAYVKIFAKGRSMRIWLDLILKKELNIIHF